MTLKEKFDNLDYFDSVDIINNLSHDSHECEKIADEFAIGFAEFIEGTYSYSNIFDYWYLHADTSKTFTKKELLETYKKEKGL